MGGVSLSRQEVDEHIEYLRAGLRKNDALHIEAVERSS